MAITYLRLRNFWEYQNADAWKKAQANKTGPQHPSWCKLHTRRDYEMDALPIVTRLVWFELLRLASIYMNAIPNDSQLIVNAISIDSQDVDESIRLLLAGRWISETKTTRLSRNPSRKTLPRARIEVEVEVDNPLPPSGIHPTGAGRGTRKTREEAAAEAARAIEEAARQARNERRRAALTAAHNAAATWSTPDSEAFALALDELQLANGITLGALEREALWDTAHTASANGTRYEPPALPPPPDSFRKLAGRTSEPPTGATP